MFSVRVVGMIVFTLSLSIVSSSPFNSETDKNSLTTRNTTFSTNTTVGPAISHYVFTCTNPDPNFVYHTCWVDDCTVQPANCGKKARRETDVSRRETDYSAGWNIVKAVCTTRCKCTAWGWIDCAYGYFWNCSPADVEYYCVNVGGCYCVSSLFLHLQV